MSLEFITEGLIKVHHQEYEEICELATVAVVGKLIFSILNDKKNLNIDTKEKFNAYKEENSDLFNILSHIREKYPDYDSYVFPAYLPVNKYVNFNHYNLPNSYIKNLESDDIDDSDLPVTIRFDGMNHALEARVVTYRESISMEIVVPASFYQMDITQGYDKFIFNIDLLTDILNDIPHVVQHELMHIVQLGVLGDHRQVKKKENGSDPLIDYLTSPVEFQPMIASMVGIYRNQYGDDNSHISDFIRQQTFFKANRKYAPKRYQIALKKFTDELLNK